MTEWGDITEYLYEELKKNSINKINIPNLNLEKLVFKNSESIPLKQTKKYKRGLYKAKHNTYKYTDFYKLNKLHNKYFEDIVKDSCMPINQIISKMELTGAKMMCSGFKEEFIICEERKNVIFGILPNNSVKMFPKNNRIFKFVSNEKIFYLIGEYLKLKRCYKK